MNKDTTTAGTTQYNQPRCKRTRESLPTAIVLSTTFKLKIEKNIKMPLCEPTLCIKTEAQLILICQTHIKTPSRTFR